MKPWCLDPALAPRRLLALAAGATLLASAGAAQAAPIADASRVVLFNEAGNLATTQELSTEAETTASETVTSSFSTSMAEADLATGLLRTRASGTAPSGSTNDRELADAFAAWYDVLTFTAIAGNVDLSFNLAFDGTLSRTAGSIALATLDLRIYDVTGIEEVFDADGALTLDVRLQQAFSAGYYAEIRDSFDPTTAAFIEATKDRAELSTGGIAAPVEIDWHDVFATTLTGGRQYLFAMESRSFGSTFLGTAAEADFFDTAGFAFESLGGATYESESGVFLSALDDTRDVPEPGTAALLAVALAGLLAAGGRVGRPGPCCRPAA